MPRICKEAVRHRAWQRWQPDLQIKIDDPANNMKDWQLVELSEQAMLSQADKEMTKKNWIVFLGWTPHPVMAACRSLISADLKRMASDRRRSTRSLEQDIPAECPNVGKLLQNAKFTIDMESAVMEDILGGKDAEASASIWFKSNPGMNDWLNGVSRVDGAEGLAAVKKHLGFSQQSTQEEGP